MRYTHVLLDFDRTLNDSDLVYEKNLNGFLGLTGQQVLQRWEQVHREILAKEPKERHEDMEFHYKSAFGEQPIPEAYERLLKDALNGDASLFICNDHIEEAWKIVDPLIKAWDSDSTDQVHVYRTGSWGPPAADALLAQNGHSWVSVCSGH